MRRVAATLMAGFLWCQPLVAQTLRDRITDMFRFGNGCDQPVCLNVGSGHGDHFNPAARAGSDNLIGFLANAIGVSVSNIPLSAASGGAIWTRSAEGLPVRTPTSSGPIFAERAQTLGRGRVYFNTIVTGLDYRAIRGVPLNGLVLTLPHQHVDTTGSPPDFESDVIEIQTRLSLSVTSLTSVLSYGLTDKIDLSIAVPLVRTSISGTTEAQIIPFANPTPHFFGDPSNPQLRATASASGSATGIGDIAARIKANLISTDRGGFGILGDVRFATGDENNFLGSGGTSFSVLGIGSLRRGNFSPHINAGYIHRGGQYQNDAALATLGFDHLLARGATLAVDVLTSWQLGDAKLQLPQPVEVTDFIGTATSVRVVRQTNLPSMRDNIAMGSVGGKFSLGSGANLVANALVPLSRAGLQANVVWSLGLEYSF
jgi:hypothetical protein